MTFFPFLIIPLYPVYYAPTFPQNTVSPNSIKHYNKFRSVRSEALDWIRMVTHVGQKIHIRIDPVQIGNELLDYFKVNVMTIDTTEEEEDLDKEQPSFNHSSLFLNTDLSVLKSIILLVLIWITLIIYYYIED